MEQTFLHFENIKVGDKFYMLEGWGIFQYPCLGFSRDGGVIYHIEPGLTMIIGKEGCFKTPELLSLHLLANVTHGPKPKQVMPCYNKGMQYKKQK